MGENSPRSTDKLISTSKLFSIALAPSMSFGQIVVVLASQSHGSGLARHDTCELLTNQSLGSGSGASAKEIRKGMKGQTTAATLFLAFNLHLIHWI
jgi:uncharacterized protein YfiM (DUF2279 family)